MFWLKKASVTLNDGTISGQKVRANKAPYSMFAYCVAKGIRADA